MAELTISLRPDPETGKSDIIIKLEEDQSSLPQEHEQAHREAVERLLGKNNIGKVIIQRESEGEPIFVPKANEPTAKPLAQNN